MRSSRSQFILAAGLMLLLAGRDAGPAAAQAVDVTQDVTFAGPMQNFGLTINSNGTLTVSGNARVHHIISIPLLPDIHTHTDIAIVPQTFPMSLIPSTVNLSSNPFGSATVGYNDADLSGATLSDFNVDFRNGATWNFGLNTIVIQADVNPPDLFPDFGADITLSTNLSIDAFNFIGNGPATVFPSSGSFPTVQQLAVQNGTLNASISGGVTGNVDMGSFGNNSLGQIASINSSTTDNDFDMPSVMTLAALNGPPATQVTTNLALGLPFSLDLPYNVNDTIVQNDPHSNGSLDINLSYSLQGNFTVSNLSFDLNASNAPPANPGIYGTDAFGSGANAFGIEFATIGNPGNADDTTGNPNPVGSVAETYRIAKFEISEDMINKANAESAGSANPLNITHNGRGADKPATGISWFEAAQFVNWLNTSTGSTPAYKFDGNGNFQLWQVGDAGYDPANFYRNSLAKYFLPSVDEWYKAAYYDPISGTYNNFATGSDTVPAAVASSMADFTTVFNGQAGPADVTLAGGLSPYGTVGQDGNAWEWEETQFDLTNDSIAPGGGRGFRGGAWGVNSSFMGAANRFNANANNSGAGNGFRVASVPEPSSLVLGVLAAVGLLLWRVSRKSWRARAEA